MVADIFIVTTSLSSQHPQRSLRTEHFILRALTICGECEFSVSARPVRSSGITIPAPFGAPEPLADFLASRPESQKEQSPDPLLAPTPDPWDLKMGELYRP